MMRFSRSTALASLAAATLTVSARAKKPDAAIDRAALESFIRGEMMKRRIPGLQVAVVRHGALGRP
jgi:hypothetical protein